MAEIHDPAALKALAHPLRLRILNHLGAHGPATSTTLGQVLGQNTGTTSYHLRQLERYGFIEDMPERSVGRERWWQWAGGAQRRGIRISPWEQLSDEARAAVHELDRLMFDQDLDLFHRFVRDNRQLAGWAVGLRGQRHMTTAELAAFRADLEDLVRRHGHPASDAPPDARPIEIRMIALPGEP